MLRSKAVRCLSCPPGHSTRCSPIWRRGGVGLRPQRRISLPRPASERGSGDASSAISRGKGSNSATQLTNMITGCTDLPSLMTLVQQHSDSFNYMHASAALAKAAKLGRKGQAQTDAGVREDIKQLASVAQQHLPACDARGLANMLWAVAKLRYRDEQFVRQIIAQAGGKLRESTPQELSNMALALATLGVKDTAFMQRLLRYAGSKLQGFNSQGLATLVWVLGKMRLPPDDPRFLRNLLTAARLKLPRYHSKDFSNTALGLAYLRYYDPQFMKQLLAAAGPDLANFNSQELANTAWALALLNHNDPTFTDSLVKQVAQRLGNLNSQELSNTLWSLSILDHDTVAAAPTVEALLRAVGDRLDSGAESPVRSALCQVCQYLVTAEVRGHISAQLQQEGWYQRVKKAGQSAWAQKLELSVPPNTLQQVSAIIPQIPGCEGARLDAGVIDLLLSIDIAPLHLVDGRKVAVMVNKPWHFLSTAPGMLIGPMAWRQRMLREQGWELIIVSDVEWSRLGGDAGQQYEFLLQRFTETST